MAENLGLSSEFGIDTETTASAANTGPTRFIYTRPAFVLDDLLQAGPDSDIEDLFKDPVSVMAPGSSTMTEPESSALQRAKATEGDLEAPEPPIPNAPIPSNDDLLQAGPSSDTKGLFQDPVPVMAPGSSTATEPESSSLQRAREALEPPIPNAPIPSNILESNEPGAASLEGFSTKAGSSQSRRPRKRRRTKEKQLGNTADGDCAKDAPPAEVKKSTIANRQRHAARKKTEARKRALQRSLLAKALRFSTELRLEDLPHAASTYLGSRSRSAGTEAGIPATAHPEGIDSEPDVPPYATHSRLQELVAKGYTVVDSHSAQVDDLPPDLIFDGATRLGAWKPGSFGKTDYWDASIRGLTRSYKTFVDGIAQARVNRGGRGKNSGGAPRGTHAWTTWGYSIGGGEKFPTSTTQINQEERHRWKEFLACPHFKAVTNRLMESFEMWAPDVYEKYEECHKHVLSQLKALDCINPEAPESVPFAGVTANLGPQTVCWAHRDVKNLANGVCLVLVLGSFDHHYGGHIVLHEARLILEMKPGDALFLPSAIITHETIPIQPGETRYSIVFYSAGGLFRWQDCSSRTNKEFEATDPEGFEDHFSKAKSQERWKAGRSAFPTLDDLRNRCHLLKTQGKTSFMTGLQVPDAHPQTTVTQHLD